MICCPLVVLSLSSTADWFWHIVPSLDKTTNTSHIHIVSKSVRCYSTKQEAQYILKILVKMCLQPWSVLERTNRKSPASDQVLHFLWFVWMCRPYNQYCFCVWRWDGRSGSTRSAHTLIFMCTLLLSRHSALWRFRLSFPSALVPLSNIPHSRSHVWANAARSAANGQLEDITQHAQCLLTAVGEETTTTGELLKKLPAGFKLCCSDLVTLSASSFLLSDCFCLILFDSRLHS